MPAHLLPFNRHHGLSLEQKRALVVRARALRSEGWAQHVVCKRLSVTQQTIEAWAAETGIAFSWAKKKRR